jgi:hypothetical protein
MSPLTWKGNDPCPRQPAKLRLAAAALGLLLLAGCATSGPNHLYATLDGDPALHDVGPQPKDLPAAVTPDERVLGLAYDFNTDHLFLRLAPTQVIRVIERPSGKVLREMPLPAELKTDRSADLAIRSGDRHLFAVGPDGLAVVELTLFGEYLRQITLRGLEGPVDGLAYDQKADRLLILTAPTPATTRIGSVGPDGHVTYYVTLSAPVHATSLGYDSDAQHFFVPLAEGNGVGEFDGSGALVVTHQPGGRGPVTALDAGPRSFVRVF